MSKEKKYGASNLRFINRFVPKNLIETYDTARDLIEKEINARANDANAGSADELRHLLVDMNEVPFNEFIDLDYPRFSITPHEYEWLRLHENEKESWVKYLLYRYRFKMYPVNRKLSKFPVHLLIEPTSICNLRCTMCFQVDESFSHKKNGFMGLMPWDLFKSVVDQAESNDCHAITLASRGEPTLHKRFGDMLLYIHDKGVLDVKINTNATRLSEKLCHEILSAKVATVTLSVDASDKETYEQIRVRGNFDKVLGNIQRFNDIRSKYYSGHATTMRIAGVAVQNTQSPEEMETFWSEYVDQVSIRSEIPRWDSYGNPMYQKDSICKLLYERIYVWWDGTCNPCDFDYKSYLALGNAKEQSLSEIWLGEKYQSLRKQHIDGGRCDVVPCDRCPF